ncbi:hypothetical protein EPN52_00350 [bacterium]|nr:MAG: hypothetical protein EPN52_00350 [bacterium]
MIAARLLPSPDPRRRERELTRPRRGATMRRAMWLRIAVCAAVPFLAVMAYVGLMAHVTSLGYSYAHAQSELQAARTEHLVLQDEAARLQSPQRLAAIAKRLGMKDPGTELVVRLVPPPAVASRWPLPLGTIFRMR